MATEIGGKIFEYWSVATLNLDQGSPIPMTALVKPGSSTWQRGVAAMKVINTSCPPLANRITEMALKSTELPITVNGQTWEYLTRGEEQLVFKLSNSKPAEGRVLKLNIQTIANPNANVFEVAKQVKSDYEEIKATYAGIPVDVPDQGFVIFKVKNFLADMNVLGVIEKFDNSKWTDIFDLTMADFALLRGTPTMDSLSQFVKRFTATLDSTGRYIDILGPKNVCVRSNPVTGEIMPNIMITDPHVVYGNGSKHELNSKDKAKADKNISIIRNILPMFF